MFDSGVVARRFAAVALASFGLCGAGCSQNPPGAAGAEGRPSAPASPAPLQVHKGAGKDSTASPAVLDSSSSLTDSAIWQPVPNGDSCGLYEADTAKAHFAKRVWAGCGNGCSVAPASPLADAGSSLRSASAAFIDGDFFVRVTVGSQTMRLAHLARISDGVTIGAVEQRTNLSNCLITGGAASSPRSFPFSMGAGALLVGTVGEMPGAAISWPSGWTPRPASPTSFFSWTDGWGMTFADGTVRVSPRSSANQLTTLETNAVPSYHSFGRGSWVVWTALSAATGHSVVRAYSSTTGVRTLVAQGADATVVALSDERIAWITVSGPNAAEGTYESARLNWGALPAQGGALTPKGGAALPATSNLLELQTGGDYAATIGCTNADGARSCTLLVARTSTGELLRIAPRPGNAWSDVLAIGPDEILLGEIDQPSSDPTIGQKIQRLVRLQTAQLGALGWK